MRNSSAENRDRPTLPSIWDLFGDELSEPASRHNPQASSLSIHPHPRCVTSGASVLPSGQDGRFDGWINRQDTPLNFSDLGLGPSPSSGENPPDHQVLDTAGPTSCQASIPQPYYYSQFNQTHATFEETNPGATYINFKLPVESPEESRPGKYECQYCGKAFNRPSTLQIHINSHTGDKPYVCPVESCGRGFSVLSNMRRHARVHAQSATREGTAQLSGGDTSSRDHQETSTQVSVDDRHRIDSDHHE